MDQRLQFLSSYQKEDSEVFRFEDLGFESVAEDFYKVFFRNTEIGEFDIEALRFRPAQVIR